MSKLNELFVESINKAIVAADVMSDINQKPIAYASIAQALATYIAGISGESKAITTESVEENKEAISEMTEVADNTNIEQVFDTPMMENWALPYDSNGIPYLNEEDNSYPERVLAYEEAMTPEIIAKKEAIEKAQGEAVLNERPEQNTVANAPEEKIEEVTEFTEGMINAIATFKEFFGYDQDPSALNDLVYNFTQGQFEDVDKLTPALTGVFINFVHEQVDLAKNEIENIVTTESWLAIDGNIEAGLDAIVSEAYQVEGMKYTEAIHDGTAIWFAGYLKQYVANAYFNMYQQNYSKVDLTNLIREFLEDRTATVEGITYENIIGFVEFVKGLQQAA